MKSRNFWQHFCFSIFNHQAQANMKRLLFTPFFMCLSLGLFGQPLNAVLGDSAWYFQKGAWPSAELQDSLQISNHLGYVISKLQVSHPNSVRRHQLLTYLEDYIQIGKFPSQFIYGSEEKRRPCFIDDVGTYCAVGYLMFRDGAEDLAAKINREQRFEYLLDMSDPALVAWQESSGFSLKELAMIQPTYQIPAIPINQKYEVYRSEWTGKLGLRKPQSKWIVIYPSFTYLFHPHNGPLIYGKRRGRWYAFNDDAKRLPNGSFWKHKSYDSLNTQLGVNDTYLSYFQDSTVGILDHQGYESPAIPYLECRFIRKASHFIVLQDSGYAFYDFRAQKAHAGFYEYMEPVLDANANLFAMKVLKEGRYYILNLDGTPRTGPWTAIRFHRGMYLAGDHPNLPNYLLSREGDTLLDDMMEIQPVAGRYLSYTKSQSGYQLWDGSSAQPLFQDSYEDMVGFPNIQFKVRKEGRWSLIDFQGNRILDSTYLSLWQAFPTYDQYIIKNEQGFGLANSRGQVLIEPAFDTLGILVQSYGHRKHNLYFALDKHRYRVFNHLYKDLGDSIAFDAFQFINTASALLKSDSLANRLLVFHADSITLFPLPIDTAEALGGRIYRYRQNGKYGLWASFPQFSEPRRFFKKKTFDRIEPMERSDFRYFLAQENGLWGIYSFERDSLVIPCVYDDFKPKDFGGSPQWIYLRKAGHWDGFYPTTDKVQYLRKETIKRFEAEWQAEQKGH